MANTRRRVVRDVAEVHAAASCLSVSTGVEPL